MLEYNIQPVRNGFILCVKKDNTKSHEVYENEDAILKRLKELFEEHRKEV